MLEAVARADGALGQAAQVAEIIALRAVREGLTGLDGFALQQAGRKDAVAAVELGPVVARLHRDEEGHDDAGHGGMDAGIVEEDPDQDGGDEVVEQAFLAETFEDEGIEDHQHGDTQQHEVDGAAVEEGDDEDGDEVVSDGEGRQEDLQRDGDFVAQHRQDTDGESDVRSGRDAPAGAREGAMVDCGEDKGRCYDATESRDDGQQGLFRGR